MVVQTIDRHTRDRGRNDAQEKIGTDVVYHEEMNKGMILNGN